MITIGVLALQGGVAEHLSLLQKAATSLSSSPDTTTRADTKAPQFEFIQVRTKDQLAQCDALIIPGGESTTMSIVAQRLGLLDPLREFVKFQNKPVWGTCAGLVMLAEEASAVKKGGQELIGGLDVKVLRNRYGTQIQSFVADLALPFLGEAEGPFRGVFIRAPVVEDIIQPARQIGGGDAETTTGTAPVEVLGVYRKPSGAEQEDDDIVAVRQRNVFGTSFHPELTEDIRIHAWWLKQVVDAARHGDLIVNA
ncbi:Sno-type pyridoxine vitamin B6 SNO1 [Cercophora scortea]|uniref:glutaminase n=1 Tax=Cercophora scortea TaxID=314031 RepID=A0AAE0IG71_9PEZI|nr:Sno-type pyridoxine vitamin B6 SNO1 [Cercophora scortea]